MENNNGTCYPRSLEAHQTTFPSISNIGVLDVMIMFVDIHVVENYCGYNVNFTFKLNRIVVAAWKIFQFPYWLLGIVNT